MPRISEKAQLAIQLQDLWLGNAIGHVLLTEDDLELGVVGSAGTRALVSEGRRADEDVRRHASGEATFSTGSCCTTLDLVHLIGAFKEVENSKEGDNHMYGMKGSEQGLEEGPREEIEVLGIVIAGIRYLAPREPIPRSEYLFNYHVS